MKTDEGTMQRLLKPSIKRAFTKTDYSAEVAVGRLTTGKIVFA